MIKLTVKQFIFCSEYVKDFNGTQAAIRAGYSKKTARNQANRLLTKVHIQKEIKKLTEKHLKKNEMTADKAFELMCKHATYDIKSVMDVVQIKLKDLLDREYIEDHVQLNDWKDVDGTLISEIQQTKDGIKVKLPDRQKALEQIGKVLIMFTEKVDANVSFDIEEFRKAMTENYDVDEGK